MSRLFDTPGADAAYDRWLTTTPADRAHLPECNCERCHDQHLEDGIVISNAVCSPQDYGCCVEKFADMVEAGEVCKTHPEAYFEKATKGRPAHCEGCDAN